MELRDWINAGREPRSREEASRRMVRRWIKEHVGHVPTLTI